MCHETILKFLDPARLAQILGIFQMDQWPKESIQSHEDWSLKEKEILILFSDVSKNFIHV